MNAGWIAGNGDQRFGTDGGLTAQECAEIVRRLRTLGVDRMLTRAGSGIFFSESGRPMLITLFVSKPVSTFIMAWKLRSSRPAPVSSTKASATSTTTSALRTRLRAPPMVEPRPPSFMDAASCGRAA